MFLTRCESTCIENHFFTLQVSHRLKGHSKRISGLAFSHGLNVLISSGEDTQVCCLFFHGLPAKYLALLSDISYQDYFFKYCVRSFAGTRIVGKRRIVPSCKFQKEGRPGHIRLNQIPMFSFIRIRYISLLHMRVS